MYGKQMNFFEDGGLYDEGGMMDEVSGNDVPPGSTRKEVRDDVPAMLSEGEFVFPADVVRYFGLERLMEMRQQAKMGLKKMEAMGQMGNSEEATMPDDLPFTADDLLIMIPQKEPEEMARGGVVKAQTGTFVQPSGFQDATLNTPNFVPPSSVAPINPQGTPTGYLPTFVGQSVIVPTGQNEVITQSGGTGVTDTTADTGTDFVPTVTDVYEFRKYKNAETGEIKEYAFYMGQPVIPIPDGWVPYVEEDTTATEDVTDTTVDSTFVREEREGRDGFDSNTGTSQGQTATPVGEMTNADIQSALNSGRITANAVNIIGSAVNPALGQIVGAAAVARYNDLLEEAQRRGIDTGDASRMGSIFGGEESLYAGLQDTNNDGKINFGDTWMGDLLGVDGKPGVQGPNLQDSRMGARRGATTTSKSTTSKVATTTPTNTQSGSKQTPTGYTNVNPNTGRVSNDPNALFNSTGQVAGTGWSGINSTTNTPSEGRDGGNASSGGGNNASNGNNAPSGGGNNASSAGKGGGGADSGQAANASASSAGTSSGGMSSADVAAAQEAGKGYAGGYGFNKGGLAAPKQKANKRSVNKDRGVAARKKK